MSALVEELGVDRVNFYEIIAGLRDVLRAKRGHFPAVAQRYSYTSEKNTAWDSGEIGYVENGGPGQNGCLFQTKRQSLARNSENGTFAAP